MKYAMRRERRSITADADFMKNHLLSYWEEENLNDRGQICYDAPDYYIYDDEATAFAEFQDQVVNGYKPEFHFAFHTNGGNWNDDYTLTYIVVSWGEYDDSMEFDEEGDETDDENRFTARETYVECYSYFVSQKENWLKEILERNM